MSSYLFLQLKNNFFFKEHYDYRNHILFIQMLGVHSSFSTFSPSYENIANRMNRLKHSSSSQSLNQIRPNSARKADVNVFSVNNSDNLPYHQRRRVSPNHPTFNEDTLFTTHEKVAGRVSKNTGLKKFNQRQLKEISDVKNHLRTESSPSKDRYFYCDVPSTTPYKKFQAINEEKQVQTFKAPPTKTFDHTLIPGRIYTREALISLLG